MATAAQRQATRRAKLEAAGFVQIAVWVPAAAAPELQLLAGRLREDNRLAVGPVRNNATGRLQRLA